MVERKCLVRDTSICQSIPDEIIDERTLLRPKDNLRNQRILIVRKLRRCTRRAGIKVDDLLKLRELAIVHEICLQTDVAKRRHLEPASIRRIARHDLPP